MNKKNLFREKTVLIYTFLFIFTSINRIFAPFGLDLRYFQVLIGIFLIFDLLRNDEIYLDNITKNLVILYTFAIISSIRVYYIPHSNKGGLINLTVLISSLLISSIIFSSIEKKLSFDTVYRMFSIGIIVLIFSMLFVLKTRNIQYIFGLNYNGWVEQKNFIGTNIRVGGYAEDPNHASFWIIIYSILSVYKFYRDGKVNKSKLYISLLVSFIFYLISASKTILLTLMSSVVIILVRRYLFKNNKHNTWIILKKTMIYLPVFLLIVLISIDYNLLPFSGLDTMRTRYQMWTHAFDMFKAHPILGNGLSSFRVYFENNGFWYVQAHSTIFQLISELGLLGLLLYLSVISSFFKSKKVSSIVMACMVYMMGFTNELLYLPFILIVYLLISVMERDRDDSQINSHVYIINSLKGGGAEKVVQTLANESRKEGNEVVKITLENLTIKPKYAFIKNEKIKYWINFLLMRSKLNNQIEKVHYTSNIELISNHLPKTQFIQKNTFLSEKVIFVIHGSPYLIENTLARKLFFKFVFYKQRIAVVSKEIYNYIIESKIKYKSLTIVANPLDVENLSERSIQTFPYIFDEYYVYLGRFDENKDPLFCVKSFEILLQKFPQEKLIMIGTGPIYNEVSEYIKLNELNSSIVLLGYQENPYFYLKNAKALLLTSSNEAQPMVVLEALYLKTPVISTNSGVWTSKFNSTSGLSTCEKDLTLFSKLIEKTSTKKLKFNFSFFDYIPKNVLEKYIQIYGGIKK